jgi:hypothetical protein
MISRHIGCGRTRRAPGGCESAAQGLSVKRRMGPGGSHHRMVLVSRPVKVIAHAFNAGFQLITQRA